MTVSSTTSKSGPYNGNGVTANFSVLFKYTAKADVDVIVTSAAGVETTKTLNTHYTLTNPGDTGTVSFITTPTDFRPQTGETVTIVRTMSMTQDMDLTAGGGLSAGTVEANADVQLMQIQEIAERVSRAPLLRQSSAAAPITLPQPVADNLIAWNSAGTDLENKVAADLDIGLVSPFMLTLLDDLTAAAARTTLGLVIGTDVQAWDAQLDSLSSASANGVSLVTAANYAAMRALLDLEAGTDFYSIAAADAAFLSPAEGNAAYQPLDAQLTQLAALTSLSDIPVTPTGGSTSRTLAARFADWANVDDFGAVGDGVAADRAAFVSAYTAAVANDVPMIVPGGDYNFASDYIPAAANLKLSISPDAEFNGVGKFKFDNLIPYQIAPTFAREFIYGEYDSSFSSYFGIFQNASFAKANLATAAVVAQFGEAEAAVASALAWGGNFVGVASFSGGTALGIEVNSVVTAAGGIAYGVVIASAGSQPSTAAIQIQSNESASRYANGIIFNNTTHDATTGSLILGNVGAADRGIDLSLMAFATAELLLPSFVVGPTPGSINSQIRVDGSAAALPELTAVGSATNITMILRAKGSGTIFSGDGFRSDDPLKGIGYSAGAGGAVTQLVARTANVTLDKVCGNITLFTAAGVGTWTSFTVFNSMVEANDTIIVNVKTAPSNLYVANVTAVIAGGFRISFASASGTASDTPVFSFSVIKAVAA